MSEALMTLNEWTRDEAVHALSQLRGTEERQRTILLEMHTHKAHKALNYPTWEAYANKEFGVSRSRYYEMLDSAIAERVLLEAGKGSLFASIASGSQDAVFVELRKLKTAEQMVLAFEEAVLASRHVQQRGEDSRHNGSVTGSLVRGIVGRMLSPTVPDRSEKPRQAIAQKATGLNDEAPPHPADALQGGGHFDGVSVAKDNRPAPSAFDQAAEQNLPVPHRGRPEGAVETKHEDNRSGDTTNVVSSLPHDLPQASHSRSASRADTADGGSDTPEAVNMRATTAYRDDERRCLIVTFNQDNGGMVCVWTPYALLPREMQPR